MANVHEFKARTIDGQDKSLGDYRGRAMLVVNVASQCGLTPQYSGLEELHKNFGGRGLSVVGFPCNQFGKQEPGTENEIKTFCESKYGVSFDLFSKIDVNGADQHPLYAYLTGEGAKFPGKITWNFEKFLIDRNGDVLQRFSPRTAPDDADLVKQVEAALPG